MATVSSHVLDAVRGCSAVGVQVTLIRIAQDGDRRQLFSVRTDAEGRISESVDVLQHKSPDDPAIGQPDEVIRYELEFETADYFRQHRLLQGEDRVLQSVVVRIEMPDPDKRYHIPVIASPHSYSLWWSA